MFKIGDMVIVAEASNQKYRPDLILVEILNIKETPNQTVYYLSDGTTIKNKRKMRLINS